VGKYWGKDKNWVALPATESAINPGALPVGSIESRAAARAMAEYKDNDVIKLSFEGLPSPYLRDGGGERNDKP
jgi:hypothetical protein